MANIEYFYSAHSLFAYFGDARLREIAVAARRDITHRPMDLGKVLAGNGAQPFDERSQAHLDYFFGREEERWAEFRDAPILPTFPHHHYNDATLANCMLIAGKQKVINIGQFWAYRCIAISLPSVQKQQYCIAIVLMAGRRPAKKCHYIAIS